MKKAYIYLTSFFVLVTVFSISYFISFQSMIGKMNPSNTNQNLNSSSNNTEPIIAKNEETTPNEQVVKTEANKTEKITPDTKYTLENCDLKDQAISSKKLNTPDYLIGLTREGTLNYIEDYMEDIPFEEYQKGLVSYELVSFSADNVVLRKTYNSGKINYQYYLAVEDGLITVYYSDKKTVYDYTDIKVEELAQADQERLNYGVFITDLQELYSMLESYSS